MTGRMMLLGATGYTGRLAAREMVRTGCAPVLLGRSAETLEALVADLDGTAPPGRAPTFEVVDLERPASLRRLLASPDDVLVSAAGPFSRIGTTAVSAATDAGTAYVDCAGEPAFIREVFEHHGPRAERTGARLLPACGYEFVPGNLAATIALDRHPDAGITRIDIGYFLSGQFTPSSGTIASVAGVMLDPSFALRDGAVVTERSGAHVMRFDTDGRSQDAISIGGSEHFALPRLDSRLRTINVQVGWIGRWSRAASAAGALATNAMAVPGVGAAMGAVMRSALGGATATGPADHQRARVRTTAVALAYTGHDDLVARVQVEGPSPYDLTAGLLTWSGRMLSRRMESGVGALGPADAFGPGSLISGCVALGLAPVD